MGYCLHANFVLSKVRQFEAELHGLYDIEILFQSLELKAVEATIVRDLKLQRVPEITLL